jgi:hypothetical protein
MKLPYIQIEKKNLVVIFVSILCVIIVVSIVFTAVLLNSRENVAPSQTKAATSLIIDKRIGITHIDGKYPNLGSSFLTAGADRLKQLGFQSIEIEASLNAVCNGNGKYQTSQWCTNTKSLSDFVSNTDYSKVFDEFNTIFITSYSIKRVDSADPRNTSCDPVGLIDLESLNTACGGVLATLKSDYKQYAKDILLKYKNTGKTFVNISGNEFDYELNRSDPYNINVAPPKLSLENTILYWNTIQDAINEAKAEVGETGMKIYNACEVSKVWKTYDYYKNRSDDSTSLNSLNEFDSLTNKVLPNVHCDLYGYSSYDSAFRPYTDQAFTGRSEEDLYKEFINSFRYIQNKVSNQGGPFGNNNVFISEFGVPKNVLITGQTTIPADKTEKMLCQHMENSFGIDIPNCGYSGIQNLLANLQSPYFLYWQLYDNECNGAPTNTSCRGYWIIKPDGSITFEYNKVIVAGFGNLITVADTPVPTQVPTNTVPVTNTPIVPTNTNPPIPTTSTGGVTPSPTTIATTYNVKVNTQCTDNSINLNGKTSSALFDKVNNTYTTERLNKPLEFTFTQINNSSQYALVPSPSQVISNGRIGNIANTAIIKTSSNIQVNLTQISTTYGSRFAFEVNGASTFNNFSTPEVTFLYLCSALPTSTIPLTPTATPANSLTVHPSPTLTLVPVSTATPTPISTNSPTNTINPSVTATVATTTPISTPSNTPTGTLTSIVTTVPTNTLTPTSTNIITMSPTAITTNTTTASTINPTASVTSTNIVLPTTLSNIKIVGISVSNNSSIQVSTSKPKITGQAIPNSTISILINNTSNSITANSSGNWSFTPSENLILGVNTIVITSNEVTNTIKIDYSESLPNTGLFENILITISISVIVFLIAIYLKGKSSKRVLS